MSAIHNSRVRHIFTYGTLMSTATGDMGAAERALMSAFAECLGPAAIRGRMFHAGACPGVLPGGTAGEIVHGELWRIPAHMPDLLAALDRYEGCAPHCPLPHSYARRRIRVRNSSDARVTAWIYVWVRSTEGLVPIPDGRWRGVLPATAAAGKSRSGVAA